MLSQLLLIRSWGNNLKKKPKGIFLKRLEKSCAEYERRLSKNFWILHWVRVGQGGISWANGVNPQMRGDQGCKKRAKLRKGKIWLEKREKKSGKVKPAKGG